MLIYNIFYWLLVGASIILLLPVITLVAQIFLARQRDHAIKSSSESYCGRVAVLVPAHNEEAVIFEALTSLLLQLRPDDRLVVVADNCVDATADLARRAGAEVVERFDDLQKGKGFALDFGVRHLACNPPDVLVIVDADCQMKNGSLTVLAATACDTGRPIQALDLMRAPIGADIKLRISAFAWRVKNWVRPLGWNRMNWPCQLMGTGMAFPWLIAERMALANGHLVEDMKLGAELALAGTPPLFCPQALVTSDFPIAKAPQESQRRRWEHGHMSILFGLGPRFLWQGIKKNNLPSIAMALDLLVPPVALLGLLLALQWMASLVLRLMAGVEYVEPLIVTTILVIFFKAAVLRAWWGWGRDLVSARDWLHLPLYLLAKVPLYIGFLFNRQIAWIKTERN